MNPNYQDIEKDSYNQLLSPNLYQHQIVNYFIYDSHSVQDIKERCIQFVGGLSQLDQMGLQYARMISKIFGFEKVSNYRALLYAFMRERAKFLKYYANESQDHKEIKDAAQFIAKAKKGGKKVSTK